MGESCGDGGIEHKRKQKRTHGQEQQCGICRGNGLVEVEKVVGEIHGMKRIR